jgi:hypothetical protein
MSYLLLAVEILTASLLFVALAVALVAWRGPWMRAILMLATVGLCLAVYALAIWVDYDQEFVGGNAKTGLFVPLVVMTAVFAVAAAIIVRRGLRTRAGIYLADQAMAGPAARGWSRGRLAVALGVAVVLCLMTLANLDAAARASMNTLRSEAYELAMSVAPQPVADEENAATYYAPAVESLLRDVDPHRAGEHRFWVEAVDALTLPEGTFDYGSAEVTEFVEAHRGEVEMLRKGAALPHYYYDRNYGQIDVATLLPDIQAMREAARLLAIHGRWSAATGDAKNALADVTAIGGVARHAGGDPFAVTMLVGASLDKTAFDLLQTVLRTQTPPADALEQARVNHLFSYRRQTNRILRGEEAAMLNTMVQLDSALAMSTAKWLGGTDPQSTYFGHTSGMISALGVGPLYRVFVLLPAMAAYRRGMEQAYVSASMPYAEFTARMERMRPHWEEQGVFVSSLSYALPLVKSCYRSDAFNLVAYTALAMHRYRAAHNRFPETLAELTPEVIPIVPSDPFDQKPLKLKQTERGWIIYSVGPDMRDDGGRPLDQSTDKGDIDFEFEEKAEGKRQKAEGAEKPKP